jgi:hypothetical protein
MVRIQELLSLDLKAAPPCPWPDPCQEQERTLNLIRLESDMKGLGAERAVLSCPLMWRLVSAVGRSARVTQEGTNRSSQEAIRAYLSTL